MSPQPSVPASAGSVGNRRKRSPVLQPFPRCRCGQCRECQENARWDRIFARFEVQQYWEPKGIFQSTLRGL
jgi:hypothetical protein